jgi:hypothetical protein
MLDGSPTPQDVTVLADDRFLKLGGRASITLTFAIDLFEAGGRYRSIDVARLWDDLEKRCPELCQECLGPCESFFADILTTPTDVRNRQITFLLTEGAQTRLTVQQPQLLEFTAEKHRFQVDRRYRAQHPLSLDLREAVTIFANGQAFLSATFIFPESTGLEGGSEYDLLSLQKLVAPTENCGHLRKSMLFAASGEPPSDLVNLLQARFDKEIARRGCLANIVFRQLLQNQGVRLPRLNWSQLQSGAIFLNGAAFFNPVRQAAQGGAPAPAAVPAGEKPAPLIVMTGIAQNIADFRRQDEHELGDSLRPVFEGPNFSIYCHPKFLLEVSEDSRSYAETCGSLGTCPYFYLLHVYCAYREKLAEVLERAIDRIKFSGGDDSIVQKSFLRDHVQLLGHLRKPMSGRGTSILEGFAQTRLGLFRDFFAHLSPNIFRYDTERQTLQEVLRSRGIDDRIAASLKTFEEHEKCVKDIHAYGEYVSEKQINRFLLFLAILGVVEVFSNLSQLNTETAVLAPYFRWAANAVAVLGFTYLGLRALGVAFSSLGLGRRNAAPD